MKINTLAHDVAAECLMLSYFNVQCVKTGIEHGSNAGYLAEAQVSWTNRIFFFFSQSDGFLKKILLAFW